MPAAPSTRICVPIIAADPPIADQAAAALAAGADLIELRVDRIGDLAAVEDFLATKPAIPIILTIRTRDEGGDWDGDDADRIALIEHLGLQNPGYIDLELATWRRSPNLRQKVLLVAQRHRAESSATTADGMNSDRPRNQLILSEHNLRGTPTDLASRFAALAAESPSIAKIVTTARDAADGLRLLIELARHPDRDRFIALAMGEAGIATRVLARKFGAFLTFATLAPDAQSAPGQPSIAELHERYRWNSIDTDTAVYGIAGFPVSHSRSPDWHNRAMAHAGVNGVYVPLPVAPTYDDFAAFMSLVDAHAELGIRGLSITIPHKEHAFRWLADRAKGAAITISPLATRCRAVNTLARCADGGWFADNTDATGFLAALDAATAPATPDGPDRFGSALILGAGGVARAVIAALRDRGIAITIANRTAQRAAALAAEFSLTAVPWAQRETVRADLLVNCTSVGMSPNDDETPIPAASLRKFAAVADTVYAPAIPRRLASIECLANETRVLAEARTAGIATRITGDALFEAQAAAQFRIWHNIDIATLG